MKKLGVLALTLSCATVIAGTSSVATAAATTSTNSSGASYVALGDSYSSGEGNTPFESGTAGGCDRSAGGAYGDIIAADLGLAANGTAFDFEACSGATTGDLWPGATDPRGDTAYKTFQETGLMAGEAGLGTNTKLVTVTIGGNDVGFATVLEECVAGGCLVPGLSVFSNVRNASANITALGAKLVATYRSIESAAPNAAIYVLGYPDLFSENTLEDLTPTCFARTGMTAVAIKWLYQRQLQLNAVIKTATQAAGVHYVDPNAAGASYSFAGHDICAANAWFHPLWQNLLPVSDLVYSFHPTVAGQQSLAAALVAAGATNAGTISVDSRSAVGGK